MAIVRMKKLRVVAMADRREELLQGLLRLGCVQISEPENAEWTERFRRCPSALAEKRSRLAEVNTVLQAIKHRAGTKDGILRPRPTVSREEFLGADAEAAEKICDSVKEHLGRLTALRGEESRLLAQKAALSAWVSLDVPLEQTGTARTRFRLGVCPGATDTGEVRSALADTAAELLEIHRDRQQVCYFLVYHEAEEETVQTILRPWNFSVVTFPNITGTAAENCGMLEQALAENRSAQEEASAAIAAEAGELDALRLYADRLQAEAAKAAAGERLLTDDAILFFEGWAPAENTEQVASFLEQSGCAWEAVDPAEEEYPAVPVKLKNNRFTRPLNMVTNMYVLPAYDGLDPNPLMAPFFILFYGLMMADMGYGLLMLLGAWFILKKMRAKGGLLEFGGLLGLCGVSTLLWGALTGSFFGDFLSQLMELIRPGSNFALPYLFTPLTDTLMILVGSLVLGLIQIFTGMAISVVKKFKDGRWQDAVWEEFAWWAILIGGALAVLGIGNIAGYPVLLLVGIVMLLYGATRGRKGFGKVTGIIGSVYNGVTGYFSDILSYARLMALMLAGAVIAQVFNTLGAVTGNVVTFVLVSLVGNMLNFALNLLGCYVHDLRLQCLEFFNRFYKEGGKPFRPLEIQTKYIDIIEE